MIAVVIMKSFYWFLLRWSKRECQRLAQNSDPETAIYVTNFQPLQTEKFSTLKRSSALPAFKTSHKRTLTQTGRFPAVPVDDAQVAIKAKAIVAHFYNAVIATVVLSLQVIPLTLYTLGYANV